MVKLLSSSGLSGSHLVAVVVVVVAVVVVEVVVVVVAVVDRHGPVDTSDGPATTHARPDTV